MVKEEDLVQEMRLLRFMIDELVALGEDENSSLMNEATNVVDFMLSVTVLVDSRILSRELGIRLLKTLIGYQKEILTARKKELYEAGTI